MLVEQTASRTIVITADQQEIPRSSTKQLHISFESSDCRPLSELELGAIKEAVRCAYDQLEGELGCGYTWHTPELLSFGACTTLGFIVVPQAILDQLTPLVQLLSIAGFDIDTELRYSFTPQATQELV